MKYVAILGRQPDIGISELRSLYGTESVVPISAQAALVETAATLDVQTLGSIVKLGRVITTVNSTDWQTISKRLHSHYTSVWKELERKQTLGISVYGGTIRPQAIQRAGLLLKSTLKKNNVSLRLIPQNESALSSAISHHNKLGLSENKTELLIVIGKRESYITESIGAQNITALAARDQGRPKRDAFVGMLPPKLALTMINLSGVKPGARILDPFCGTGVILQEAALLDYNVYGTDLSEKMIDYSKVNLEWLADKYNLSSQFVVHQGDAMDTQWQQPIGAVVCETYLGQPFSAPPRPEKLEQVRRNCDHIISSFLRNISPQLESGTPLCVAIPAWRDDFGNFTHLTVKNQLTKLGYLVDETKPPLLYFREDQVVAREILCFTKA